MSNLHKWYLSISLLGVGGLTALVLSPGGRQFLRWLAQKIINSPEQLQEWNDHAEKELRKIQIALDRLSESVQSVGSFAPASSADAHQ